MNSKGNKLNITIIGAGIAGLAAGSLLTNNGHNVTILETNSHAGGRILTDYSLGIPFDLGASWIHGTLNNPIAYLADQLQLRSVFTNFENLLFYDRDKKIISKDQVNEFNQFFVNACEKAAEFADAAPKDMSLYDALHATTSPSEKLSWQDLWEWSLVRLSLYTGANTKKLSARNWDEEEIIPGGNFLMLDGYKPLVDALAAPCNILFNHPVKKIIYHDKNVEVRTDQKSFHSDAVIITVSLGVLKQDIIQFEPALPAAKLRAIKNLGMGLLDKIALKFPTQFWPVENAALCLSSQDSLITHFMNYAHFWQEPILTAYVGAEKGEEIEKMSDADIIAMAMQQLKNYFGNKIPEPEKYLISRWWNNPSTYGSYSYIPVNASAKEYYALATPINNQLFFAGEATHSRFPATVHGAFLSGVREAEQIMTLTQSHKP